MPAPSSIVGPTPPVHRGLHAFRSLLVLAGGLLIYGIARLCIWAYLHTIRNADPHAYVAPDACRFAGRHTRWNFKNGMFHVLLEEALVIDGPPAVLSLAIRTQAGSSARTDAIARAALHVAAGAATAAGHHVTAPAQGVRAIRIPIPPGRVEEARKLAKALLAGRAGNVRKRK